MGKPTTKDEGRNKYPVNWWIILWFYITAIICTIDASFIVFRPHTLPGGYLHNFFYPYRYYIYTDQRYGDVKDSYVYTQSLLNYAEVVLNVICIYLNKKRSVHTRPLAFMVNIMTFWKTVLYIMMFYELGGGRDFRAGNTLFEEIFLVLIPNGIWILIPGICILAMWHDFVGKSRVH